MGKEWTDEEVSQEIANAVAIVREDRFEAFVRGLSSKTTNDQGSGNAGSGNAGSGNSNDGGTGGDKKKKSLWWGETE